jgi:hypothetical protein
MTLLDSCVPSIVFSNLMADTALLNSHLVLVAINEVGRSRIQMGASVAFTRKDALSV